MTWVGLQEAVFPKDVRRHVRSFYGVEELPTVPQRRHLRPPSPQEKYPGVDITPPFIATTYDVTVAANTNSFSLDRQSSQAVAEFEVCTGVRVMNGNLMHSSVAGSLFLSIRPAQIRRSPTRNFLSFTFLVLSAYL